MLYLIIQSFQGCMYYTTPPSHEVQIFTSLHMPELKISSFLLNQVENMSDYTIWTHFLKEWNYESSWT